MTWISVSAVMEDKRAAQRLYEHVREAGVAERVGVADGTKVIAEGPPETAGATAETFAKFLFDR